MTAADVVVVGGGTAGCIVAARLAEAGRSVVVLEGGPDYGESHANWPADLLDAASLPTTHDWGYSGPSADGRTLLHDRAKVMGGCSSHNGCTQSAGWASDYDLWPSLPGASWSAADLAPLFTRVAQQMSFQEYASEEIQPFHRAFLDASAAAGVPLRDDFHDLAAGEGAGCPPVNAVGGVRLNTSLAYLGRARSGGNLRIIDRADVMRIGLRGGRATLVEYRKDGQNHTVEADEIVLAAGAYGSPAILQRSGVGDPAHLEVAGIETLVDLPGVGRNLHDHPAAQIVLPASDLLTRRLGEFNARRWLPEEQSVVKLASPHSVGPYDLHVYPWVERRAEDGAWLCVFPVGLLTPRSRGTVRATSPDYREPPLIDTNFFGDAAGEDLAAVRFGIRWTLDLLEARELAELVGTALDAPSRAASDDEVDAWIRSTHSHYWHPAGTCRMGTADDTTAVVDAATRVIGIDGLHVTDSSIFPAIPRSTPAWPTAVVGEKVAEIMLAGH